MRTHSLAARGRPYLPAAVAAVLAAASAFPAELPPQWWRDRGALRDDAAPNDYAAVNAGQLKSLAHKAWLELETLPGGAGFAPAFTNGACDYAAVTAGQLKETARPFYDRLGLSANYPWPGTASSNDFAIANIGQAKRLFCFDPHARDFDQDGMPDQWELGNALDPYRSADAAEDADGDGLTNLDECLLMTDPNSALAAPPAATAVSGQVFGTGETGLLILTPPAASR